MLDTIPATRIIETVILLWHRVVSHLVIQILADLRQNGRIGKVGELAELRFCRDMERNVYN